MKKLLNKDTLFNIACAIVGLVLGVLFVLGGIAVVDQRIEKAANHCCVCEGFINE